MPRRKSFSVIKAERELKDYKAVKDMLAARDDLDPQTISDTLEGASSLPEALLVVANEAQEMDAMSEGLKAYIQDLQERKSRIDNAREMLRNIILQMMDTADIDTVQGVSCTLVRRRTPGQPIVNNEADIPARFWAKQPPKLDTKSLREALNNGEKVEGATLSNGGLSLTIRVK